MIPDTPSDPNLSLRKYNSSSETEVSLVLLKTEVRMKLKKNEDQSVDTSPLLKIGNKTPMEGVTEKKFGAERKGWTIQKLLYPWIHTIIILQMQTTLHTPARFC
jgi:hypothetical protein